MNSRSEAARLMGSVSTPEKSRAARANGKLGGKPPEVDPATGRFRVSFMTARGGRVFMLTADPLAHAAWLEINGRQRGRGQRLTVLDAAGAPRIHQLTNLHFDSRDDDQWLEHGRSRNALRAWLLDRLGISQRQIDAAHPNLEIR